ncbi:MAG: TraB/GumN family protein [Gammaproteobacteria bacterium]|nr:TraB/GumN family protein [Gammaproteobacteria bacterium]
MLQAAPPQADYDPTKTNVVASPAPTSTPPVPPAKEAAPQPRTLLWEVKSKPDALNKNTLYLFGTIHVGKSSFYPLPATVDAAFTMSRKLVVEANILNDKDGAEIARLSEYPKGETIAKHIPPALLTRLKTTLAKQKIPYDNVASMRPVLLGGLLPIVEFIKQGYEMNQGLDFKLIERATNEKKTILELESSLAQIKLLTGMSPLLQEAFLENALSSLDDGKAAKQVNSIVTAWQQGDAAQLARIAEAAAREGRMTDMLNEQLLAGRHPAMVDKIEGYLASPDIHFVAVGSLHLVGVGGLVEMLKSLGYLVRQL